jgi:hypothetical protein
VVIALLVVAAVAIVIVALVAVGHAVGSTEAMPAQIVVDVHEAIEFCAEALPDEATAVLSYDELRRLLRLHLEWIQAYHWSPEGASSGPIVFEQFDALDYVMERAEVTGLEVTRAQAAAVIQAHSDYLQVMGAIHIDDPVKVDGDLAELPLLDDPRTAELDTGDDVDAPGGARHDDDPVGERRPVHGADEDDTGTGRLDERPLDG